MTPKNTKTKEATGLRSRIHLKNPVALTALVALTMLTSTATAQEITGAWRFNPELSSSPESLTRGRIEGPQAGGGGGLPGLGGRPSDDDRRRAQAMVRRLRDAPQRLTIVRSGMRFTFTDEGGRSWSVTADGKKETRLTGDGEIETKARIDGSRLIVEEDLNGPGRLVYEYSTVVENNVTQLRVVVRVDGGRRPLELRRVYEGDM
jgi:hypothetical protein